jgi:alkanesulfonate monooxygenase SsuD/methylene tetrahydromethanopterin reductase-like flavin-dependent oxidoreductase (luciferase family)
MSVRFGVFALPVPATDSAADATKALRDAIDDVVIAESLGFDAAWVAEHHGTRYGGACPSANLLLSHLAAITSKISLGTAITILPLGHPIRLAEEALLLHHLTAGRFEVGIGKGFLSIDFAALEVPFEERHELFETGLARFCDALNRARESHNNEIRIHPALGENDDIPIWAAVNATEAIALVAEAGMGLMLNPYTRPQEEIARAIAEYRSNAARAGHTPRVLIHEHLFVTRTEEDARDLPRPFLMKYLEELRDASAIAPGGVKTQHGTGPDEYERLFPARVAFGTPAQIEDRLNRWADAGVTDFAFSVRFGGIPTRLVRESMELFSRYVVPGLRFDRSLEGCRP